MSFIEAYPEHWPFRRQWVSLITPGHPRIPQDTPGHINTLKDTFIRLFLLCFLNQIRFIFIECVIKSNITIKNIEYVLSKYE